MSSVIYPVLAQVFLTLALMILMAIKRVGGARARRYKIRDIAVNNNNYPDDIRKFGNAYANQFELPVLFYLLTVLLIITGKHSSNLYVGLASLFVLLRYIHAFIHVTSNHVIRRFYAFLAGAVVLVCMWILFAVSVFVGF